MSRLLRSSAGMLMPMLFGGCVGVQMITVLPEESNDTLINPGRGFATSFRFNEDMTGVRHPHCTVAQFSFYWDELEPAEGEIAFGLLDSLLARARSNGQKLNFRVMCQNGRVGVPQWLRDAGLSGQAYPDGTGWQPDYDHPLFIEKHARFIQALGGRYDGHPDLDCVDIASLGRWGEWHTWQTGAEMPSADVQRQIVDLYLEAFRSTPLVMQIGGGEMLARAVKGGAGWRADCFGDLGEGAGQWSHMRSFYPQALEAADAGRAWRHGPVVFESCWTMQQWYDQGWDIDFILAEALRWHGSVWSNKSEPVPEQWWPQIVEFEKRMGYRFVFRRIVYPARGKAGGIMALSLEIENTGVAPCYHRYPPVIELVSPDTDYRLLLESGIDMRSWMPGVSKLELSLGLPGDMPAGRYELRLALIDPTTGKPGIRPANRKTDEQGWYSFGVIEVR